MTQRMEIDERIMNEALAWRADLEHDDADWDAYIAWLEADARHRSAFNALDLVAAAVDEHSEALLPLLQPATPVAPIRTRTTWRATYVGAGIAAAVALFFAVPTFMTSEAARTYQAGSDKPRVIALTDGIEVTLSPSSRIVVHGDESDRVELAAGEAFFSVKHDPARTFTVRAGQYSIADIGTRFAVNLNGKSVRVGVSEGIVSVSAGGREKPINVTAGNQLLSSANGLTVSPVAATEVGSWMSGRLTYSNAPLSLVISDISRYTGRPVLIDPSLENSHFSGSLVIGDGSRLLRDLAAVMGGDVRPERNGDRLSAGTG